MDRVTGDNNDGAYDSPPEQLEPENGRPTHFPSAQSQLKPKLDAIFDEIQRNLPSIDDNIEDEDLAETVEIFRHPHRRSASFSDDDEKDLDESLLPESFHGAGGATMHNRHDVNDKENNELEIDTVSTSGSALRANFLLENDFVQSEYPRFTEFSRIAWANDVTQNEGTQNAVHTQFSSDSRASEFQSNDRSPRRGERSTNALLPGPVVKLSMNGLEDVDFDVLLQRAVETEYRTRSRKISVGLDDVIKEASALSSDDESCQRLSTSTQSSLNNAALMEKLAVLCSSHTGMPVMIDPQTGAAVNDNLNTSSTTTTVEKSVQRQEPDHDSKPHVNSGSIKDRKPYQEDERHTVFLDLRHAESKGISSASKEEMQKAVARRVLGLHGHDSSDTSSSDEDNDDGKHSTYARDAWFEQRRRIREASLREAPPSNVRNLASNGQVESQSTDRAISTAPEQHIFRSSAVHQQYKPLTKRQFQHEQQSTSRDEQKRALAEREAGHNDDNQSPVSHNPETFPSSQLATSVARSISEESRSASCNQSTATQGSGSREAAAVAKVTQSRARLKSNLEALRPTTSTNGKRNCAETTPVIFDSTGSYANPISSIMATQIAAKESVLLTVYLASNGEIVEHRSPAMKPIDSGNCWPASYLVLLSWLASLIPNTTDETTSSGVGSCHGTPFDVVGMQQMWFRGRLMLVIAIVPTENRQDKCSSVARKFKKKDGEQATHFQQIVAKFLATHSLRDACCPWLQSCEPQPIGSRLREHGEACSPDSYVYYAPAPAASSKVLSTFVHINPDPEAACKVFNARLGFFWQTVDDHREIHDDDWSPGDSARHDTKDKSLTHVTFVTVKQCVYKAPEALFAVLARSLQQGLDIAGVRLLVTQTPVASEPCSSGLGDQTKSESDHSNPPLLAFALRGTFARPVWLEELGPADPSLARRTDPNSLMALYGGDDRTATNLYTPRSEFKIAEELTTFFGGRVPSSGVINVGFDTKVPKTPPTEEGDLVVTDELSSVAHLLTATVESDVLVVISRLVPVRCFGIIISACQRRGYVIRGMRRKRLSSKQAVGMGISEEMVECFASQLASGDESGSCLQAFCHDDMSHSSYGSCMGSSSTWGSRPATILHLRKENGAHHATSLVECFMVQLTLQGQLDRVCLAIHGRKLRSSHLFHVIPYSKHVYQAYAGGDFMKVPDLDSPAAPGYIAPRLHHSEELEQVVVLALNGREQAATFGLLLADILGTPPHQRGAATAAAKRQSAAGDADSSCCFGKEGPVRLELLGMKWLPRLSIGQAKELTPCEPGDREWKSSLHWLTAGPAVILCLRGIKPHVHLRHVIEQKAGDAVSKKQNNYEKIFSTTADMAYRLASMFFFDHELFPDDESRPLLPYLPPCRASTRAASSDGHSAMRSAAAVGNNGGPGSQRDAKLSSNQPHDESILKGMLFGPRPLATVLVVRPSVLRRNNLARLFRALFHEGFRLAGLTLRSCSETEAQHIMQQAKPLPNSTTEKTAESGPVDRDELAGDQLLCLTSAESLVVSLLRENGVKRLLDILGPEDPVAARRLDPFLLRGCYGTNLADNGFYGSTNYATSVKDIKMFFPNGLSCVPSVDLDHDEVLTSVHDRCLVPYKRTVQLNVNTVSPHDHLGMPSADLLTEINCLLLMPGSLSVDGRRGSRSQPLLIDILECLQVMNFSIVGAKLLLLSDEQARCYLHLVNAGSFQLVPELTASACLVLAVQRDNAVTTFPYLLKSGFAKANLEHASHERYIMYPKDIDTAKKTLCFFFESLSTAARWKISEKHGD